MLLLFCLQQQVSNFGEPFFLAIHDGETLAEVKVRVQKKLQVPDEEFAKVFALYLFIHLVDQAHSLNKGFIGLEARCIAAWRASEAHCALYSDWRLTNYYAFCCKVLLLLSYCAYLSITN